jgi:hypothetical protein
MATREPAYTPNKLNNNRLFVAALKSALSRKIPELAQELTDELEKKNLFDLLGWDINNPETQEAMTIRLTEVLAKMAELVVTY